MCAPQQSATSWVWSKPSRESLKVLRFWRLSWLWRLGWFLHIPDLFGCWCLVRASYTWSSPPPKAIFTCFFAKFLRSFTKASEPWKTSTVTEYCPKLSEQQWCECHRNGPCRQMSDCCPIVEKHSCSLNSVQFFIPWIFVCFSLAALAFEFDHFARWLHYCRVPIFILILFPCVSLCRWLEPDRVVF